MKHNDAPKTGIGRRGFFAGMVTGLGIAAIASGARKVRAAAQQRLRGPVLYRRTEETERYLKTMF